MQVAATQALAAMSMEQVTAAQEALAGLQALMLAQAPARLAMARAEAAAVMRAAGWR
jgi:hypothetical protein